MYIWTRGYINVKKTNVKRIQRSAFSTLLSMTIFKYRDSFRFWLLRRNSILPPIVKKSQKLKHQKFIFVSKIPILGQPYHKIMLERGLSCSFFQPHWWSNDAFISRKYLWLQKYSQWKDQSWGLFFRPTQTSSSLSMLTLATTTMYSWVTDNRKLSIHGEENP